MRWARRSKLVVSENSNGLRRLAVVVLQKPTEPFAHVDNTLASGPALNEIIGEPLMRAFVMVMRNEFADGMIQRSLPDKDHLVETLRLDRTDEAFSVRVHVWCPIRR